MSMPLLGTILGKTQEQGTEAGPGPLGIALFATVFGAIAGALFGAVQSLTLQKYLRPRWPWVLGNVAGWALGLPLSYWAGSQGTADMSGWQALGLSAAAGAGMGLTVGLATGLALLLVSPATVAERTIASHA